MYSPNRGYNVAIHPGKRGPSEDRSSARALALPALAAAVHVSAAAAIQAARANLAAQRLRLFVHEDDPTD